MTGAVSHYAGSAAEDIVARFYVANGYKEERRRWRGPGGEVDLILSHQGTTVFVEVKKSRDFQAAAARVSARQLQRVAASAAAFIGSLEHGQNSSARIDVALVDQHGNVEVIENIMMH